MAAYHVADATDAIKLDAMENPWRLPGALQAELAQRLAALAINRYPSGNTYTALKQAIARHDGLDGIDGLVLGNGSDELISLLCQLVAQPGATIMAPAPSFVMYEMGARLAGVGFVPVPLRPDFSLDREAMLQAIETHRPALVFLAYPNNPTGNLFDADDVRAILQATDGLVVLDEAYAPFAGGASWLSQLPAWPNLAVMRTCSKWGLAGARIGYLASAPAWAAQLDKIRPPYNISVLDAETACFAFQHHADFDQQTQALCTERQTLVQRLQALLGPQGLSHVYPTAANFVLVRLAGGQGDATGPSPGTRAGAAPGAPDEVESPRTDGAGQGEGGVVVAVSPRHLLDEWATGTPEQIRYLRTVLEGTDPLRVSRHTLGALQEAKVDLVPRAGIVRLLHNPRFLAYATVFIYSSLRALPAVYAPGFRGNPWVLWAIDIITAVPYTWGIIAMVAGKRRRIRFAGFLVTLITFVAPYVYFFLAGDDGHGNQYPGWVIMVVIGLVLATFLLEGGRWLRGVGGARPPIRFALLGVSLQTLPGWRPRRGGHPVPPAP